MTEEKDKVIALNLGCCPKLAVSGALLLQTEYKPYLTFNAQREVPDGGLARLHPDHAQDTRELECGLPNWRP